MAIPIIDIGATEVEALLRLEESHFADLKAIEVRPAKLTKTMSAFANADGGELSIGIDEDKTNRTRSWRGFTSVEDANGHIQAFEATFPLDGFVEY